MDSIEPRSDGAEHHGLLSMRDGGELQRKTPISPARLWSEQEFVTVDWVHDVEVARHHRELAQKQKIFGPFIAMYDAVQGWLCLAIVGVATGLAAGMIDFGVEWLFDLKFGYCQTHFFMSKGICCMESSPAAECDTWISWSQAFVGYRTVWLDLPAYVLLAMLFCLMSAWLVAVFARRAAGSGIPEMKTILGGFVMPHFLSGWTLLVKSLGLILSVGAGLSLGKEGPFVHVASCCGNLACEWFPKYRANEAKKREILSASCAAGVSVAFGAPIGGVLFSLEEVSSYFPNKTMWRAFLCAVVAGLTLKYMNPNHTGKLVLFQVTYHHDWHWFEMPAFVFLGAAGGLLGGLFIRFNSAWCRIKRSGAKNDKQARQFAAGSPNHGSVIGQLGRWLGKHPVHEAVIIALVTSVLSYQHPYLRTEATDLLSALFSECRTEEQATEVSSEFRELCGVDPDEDHNLLLLLVIAAMVKLGLTIVTFGIKLPAGLFVPSLTVGACLGRAVGISAKAFQQQFSYLVVFEACVGEGHCVTPGIYAMVGAAAVLGGVTRMTVSLVVIMFELTGGLEYVLPIMVSVIISKWVGDAVEKEGVYDRHIRLNQYPFLDAGHNDSHSPSHVLAAADVMTPWPIRVLYMDTTVSALIDALQETSFKGFPVVTNSEDHLVVGYISRAAVSTALEVALTSGPPAGRTELCTFAPESHRGAAAGGFNDLSPWLDRFPMQLIATTRVDRLYDVFGALGLRYVLITHHGRLVGMVKKKDLLGRTQQYYEQHTHSEGEEKMQLQNRSQSGKK